MNSFKIDEGLYQGSMPWGPLPPNVTNLFSLVRVITPAAVKVHVSMPIEDGVSPGLRWLDAAARQLSLTVAQGDTLVHCEAGRSRSVLVCAAYLMLARHLTAADALREVRGKSRLADPAAAFVRLLQEYQPVSLGDADVLPGVSPARPPRNQER